jgi:hypothetical protein
MSTVENLVCYLEYDEGDMRIRIVDAIINMGIRAWGFPLNLSLVRDGADLLILHHTPNTASTPTGGESTVKAASPEPAPLPSNQVIPPTSG